MTNKKDLVCPICYDNDMADHDGNNWFCSRCDGWAGEHGGRYTDATLVPKSQLDRSAKKIKN